jgi:hypothetical protein
MLIANVDIIFKIVTALSDYEKIKLSETCKTITKLKQQFLYCDKIDLAIIKIWKRV